VDQWKDWLLHRAIREDEVLGLDHTLRKAMSCFAAQMRLYY
jgi:hypothetical protein